MLHYASYFKRDHLIPLLIVLYATTNELNAKTNKGKTPLQLANDIKHQPSIQHLASPELAKQILQQNFPSISNEIKKDVLEQEKEMTKRKELLELARAKKEEELLKAKQVAYEKEREKIEREKQKQELLAQEKELERQKQAIEKAKQDAIEQAKKDAAEKAEVKRLEMLKQELQKKEEQKRKEEQEKAAKEQVRIDMEQKRLEEEREQQEKQDVVHAKRAVKDWLSSLNLSRRCSV